MSSLKTKFDISFNKSILDYGIEYNFNNIKVIFGNKNLSLEKAQILYPKVEFIRINQKHTTTISTDNCFLDISDGHQWSKKNHTCVIRTADCLPLIAINHNLDQITNLHCGRQGLVDGILNEFLKISDTNANYSFFIGPHIETYEIGEDLYNSLKVNFAKHLYIENNKYYFSLSSYTKDFLVNHFKSYKIYECNINTYTDRDYWSYRVDKSTPFRNINFAFLG